MGLLVAGFTRTEIWRPPKIDLLRPARILRAFLESPVGVVGYGNLACIITLDCAMSVDLRMRLGFTNAKAATMAKAAGKAEDFDETATGAADTTELLTPLQELV